MAVSTEPSGECWCGCGERARPGKHFVQTHDRVAEAAVIRVEYGGIPELLRAHGYGPGAKNPRRELELHREREAR